MIGYPVVNTFISASHVDPVGNIISFGTFGNFRKLADDPNLPHVLRQTVIYTFATVGITTVISFVLALVLNQNFPGRTLAKTPSSSPGRRRSASRSSSGAGSFTVSSARSITC